MPSRTCEQCTAPLAQATTGRTRRFCDATCRQAARRAELLTDEYPEPWQRQALAHGWRPPHRPR